MADDTTDYTKPFSKDNEDPMVDLVRKIIATGGQDQDDRDELHRRNMETEMGKASEVGEDDTDVEPEKDSPNLFKLDGRSKEYRDTVSRISKGGKKKAEGLDGRSKGFKSTMKRITDRRAKVSSKDDVE